MSSFKSELRVDESCTVKACAEYYGQRLNGIKEKSGKLKIAIYVNRLADRPYETALRVKSDCALALRVPVAFADSLSVNQCGVLLTGAFLTVPIKCTVTALQTDE